MDRVLLVLLTAAAASTCAARPIPANKDLTVRWELFDAAATVAFYAGPNADMQDVETTRDWALVEGDVVHVVDDDVNVATELFTLRVRLNDGAAQRDDDVLCDAVAAGDTVALAGFGKINDVTCAGELTPLEFAAALGESSVIKALVLAGVEPSDWRALALAVTGGWRDAVNMLLDLGCDPNAAAPDGSTAIIYAADACRGDMVSLLTDEGAEMFKGPSGWTAVDLWDAKCMPEPFRDAPDRNAPPDLYPLPLLPVEE